MTERTTDLDRLKARLAHVYALNGAAGLLGWDQQTYMPPGGASGRADQLEALGSVVHEALTAPETGRLLEAAKREQQDCDPDSDTAAYLRAASRDFDQAVKVPADLVAELARVTTLAYEEWARARSESDYSRYEPWLERLLDLTRRLGESLGYTEEIYDALLDQYEPGMKTAQVRGMFSAIKPDTIELVRRIAARGEDAVDVSMLSGDFPIEAQRRFGERIITAMGFDWTRGRQDLAVHPFCSSFTRGDVRITTRFDSGFLPSGLFSSMHETGHALYEQGVAERYENSLLCDGTSLGVHESQSRLWENLVGRGRPFWEYCYADLQKEFPALQGVGLETWYRAINRVWPTLIRVEADEITYNLHIMLRFEMEVELLEGRLAVRDAPGAWNAKMEEYLGLTPASDAEGILQDPHWAGASFGYFPTYSVGNLLSVQFMETANRGLGGDVPGQISRGELTPLAGWLQENIYQWGRKYPPIELVQKVTGGPLDPAPYLAYLHRKFGEIYAL